MKVLVVGITPLPWKFYQALQKKHVLSVHSIRKPFLKLIAQHQYQTTIIWSESLSLAFTKKLLFQLRENFPSLNILILSNPLTSLQRAELLSAGAKDCLSNSVCTQELLARLSNISHTKNSKQNSAIFSYKDFRFEFEKKQATYKKTIVHLNKKEALLLSTLLSRPNYVFSFQTLFSVLHMAF